MRAQLTRMQSENNAEEKEVICLSVAKLVIINLTAPQEFRLSFFGSVDKFGGCRFPLHRGKSITRTY